MDQENNASENQPTTNQTAEGAAAPAQDDSISMSSEQLKERMGRAQASYLQEHFGTRDPAEVKARLEQLEQMNAAEEQRKRDQLSKEEQLQADLAAERQRAQEAQEERDAVAFESHVTRVCAELGVKNVDFAMWEIARKADELADDEQIDAREHLQGLLDDNQSRAALGVSAAVQTEPTGATTTPAGQEPNPEQTNTAPDGSAFDMNAGDWAAKKARLGIQ